MALHLVSLLLYNAYAHPYVCNGGYSAGTDGWEVLTYRCQRHEVIDLSDTRTDSDSTPTGYRKEGPFVPGQDRRFG